MSWQERVIKVKDNVGKIKKDQLDRRNFFRSAGLTAIGAGTSVIVGPGTANSQQKSNDQEKTNAKYRLTEHVKQAYRLARF